MDLASRTCYQSGTLPAAGVGISGALSGVVAPACKSPQASGIASRPTGKTRRGRLLSPGSRQVGAVGMPQRQRRPLRWILPATRCDRMAHERVRGLSGNETCRRRAGARSHAPARQIPRRQPLRASLGVVRPGIAPDADRHPQGSPHTKEGGPARGRPVLHW